MVVTGSMVAGKQTWYWRMSWNVYILIHRQRKKLNPLGLAWTSETSKPTPSNTPPPTKLHPLQSGNNHLEWQLLWACGTIFIQTTTPVIYLGNHYKMLYTLQGEKSHWVFYLLVDTTNYNNGLPSKIMSTGTIVAWLLWTQTIAFWVKLRPVL